MSENAEPAGPSHISAADPEVLARERAQLAELQQKPLAQRMLGYARLSGPGWLQAAFTLGGGTLASSLIAGTMLGYRILWVQPLAMICGVIMFSAVARQTLNTEMRPFDAVRRHVHPAMAWGWALSSLLASLIWSLPQYSLSVSVLSDISGKRIEGGWSLIPSLIIFAIVTAVVWNYGSRRGVRLFELIVKLCIAMIIICFGLVVIKLALGRGIDWGSLLAGYFGFHVPHPGAEYPAWSEMAAKVTADAAALGKPDPKLMERFGSDGSNLLIAAGATVVGINMTFMYPYTLRARGWTKEHIGLAQFDLWVGLLIPFMITSSLIVIAAAGVLHGDPTVVTPDGPSPINADATTLAKAIEPATGKFFAHTLFGIGVLGMTISSICMLQLVCGFIMTEILNADPRGKWYKIGTLLPITGILGPLVWAKYKFYMAVPTSVINFFFLPIAYISFFVLDNRKDYLGEARPKGGRRIAWNIALAVVIAIVATGAIYKISQMLPGLIDKLRG